MGSPRKKEKVEEVRSLIKANRNFVLSTYSGLNVEKITDLRRRIRQKNGRMKVVKNNLFRIVLKESAEHAAVGPKVDPDLFGPIAITFSTDQAFPAVSKVLIDYAKEAPELKVRSGALDGRYLNAGEVKEIANLPSREELLAIIARGLNAPTQKIAFGIKELVSRLGRAINAVGEKNG